MNFAIKDFEIWAPGITNKAAFTHWNKGGELDPTVLKPPNAAVPPMIRRRLSLAGKMALETAFTLVEDGEDLQTVFCSRHGEIGQSVKQLKNLASGEGASPMAFSLSVHNCSAGIFSMAAKSNAATTALASGPDSLATGLVEAVSRMTDVRQDTLLVFFETPLPGEFSRWQEEEGAPIGLALRLTPGEDYSLDSDEQSAGQDSPACLALAQFLSGQEKSLEFSRGLGRWILRRHV